jgi:hypothetical protein
MQFPWNFSDEGVAEVERAQLEAWKHLRQQTKSTAWSRRKRGVDETHFRKYVLRVFLAFAQEVCKLGMEGKWRVDTVRVRAYEFLDKFWTEAYDELHKDLVINRPCYSPSETDLEREFGHSAEWRRFECDLLAVATAQSGVSRAGLSQSDVGKKLREAADSDNAQNAKKVGSKKPGPTPRLPADFVVLAGEMWIERMHKSGQATVTNEQLGEIASELDAKGYVPPAQYLERKYANELKSYNSRNSNSKTGPIMTWTALIATPEKDHVRGMRKLLSRCAEKDRRSHLTIVRK